MPNNNKQNNEDFKEENIIDYAQDDQDYNKNQFSADQKAGLGRSQKIAAISLAFFAFLVIIFWSIQFKKSITSPLAYQADQGQTQEAASTCTGPDCTANEEEALKTKDTDGDGLTDWDELNIYHTSPYLEDSDSDGFSDKEEIESDNNPNCPTGRDCSNIENLASSSPPAVSSQNDLLSNDLLNQLNQEQAQAENQAQTQDQEIEKVLSGQADAATLRQVLIESGVDKVSLDKISDEELLATYKASLEGQ